MSMDDKALRRALESGRLTVEEIFLQTPADEVDEAMAVLKRCRPPDEVCRALYERIGAAPLGEFEVLKAADFKHCEK
jgi:hypothetical protein